MQAVKGFFGQRVIHHAPPDFIPAARLLHEVLVFGRTARKFAGLHDQCPVRGKHPFAAMQGVFKEGNGGQMSINVHKFMQANFAQFFPQ